LRCIRAANTSPPRCGFLDLIAPDPCLKSWPQRLRQFATRTISKFKPHAGPWLCRHWFCRHSDPSCIRNDIRCRSMRKGTKWVSGLLIFLLSLPLFGAALFYVAMNGGIYSIILNMKSRPDLDSPDLKRNGTKLEEQIDADFSRAVPNGDFVQYETSTQDTCYDGANNWKHQDGFAHRCTLRVTNFLWD
jgi:hypothetical protein